MFMYILFLRISWHKEQCGHIFLSMETKSHLQLHNAADILLSNIKSSVKLTVSFSPAINKVIENI